MKIKDLFRISGVTSILSGGGTYLTDTSGFIVLLMLINNFMQDRTPDSLQYSSYQYSLEQTQ